ncbi:MAG: lantibiotic ABC transporter permease [Firmicutes bacterium ML8_F2]|nr:MAG: lantibiotic ABC transporter permease [Firmicutes bacterium ML8_F2]
MTDAVKLKTVRIIVLITYLIMIAVNGLANALPINNLTTGEVSDSFPNLFAPTALTFSIWGLIYLLLAAYTLYQLGLFQKEGGGERSGLLVKIGTLFAISSLVNALWIFSWHYLSIGLSLVLMLILLVLLIAINLQTHREQLNARESFFIRLPFALYFGWITVATVANVTALLVFSGWNAFGIAEQTWAVIIIAVGLLIGAATTLRFKSIPYGLVIIWAYIGIWIKHASADGLAGSYPAVIVTVIISIVLMVALIIYLLSKGKGKTAVGA